MYKTIFIYETFFQKSIIEHLIENKYYDKEQSLIIDATNHKICIEGEEYNVNFNRFGMLISSLKVLRELRKLALTCETLVGTHITGINALFFSSFISSKNKVLIDDGIGTPVLIQNQKLFNSKIKYQIRFLITKTLLLLHNIKIKNVVNTLGTIDRYYTVYKSKIVPERSFPIYPLNFYEQQYTTNMEEVCFIGAPLLDFKLCDEESYKMLLLAVKHKYGDYKYYLHPDEKLTIKFKIEGIEFIKLNKPIEKSFFKNGVPEFVIGFTSSALLNLSLSKYKNTNPNFRYVKKKVYGKKNDEYYYEILEQNNIYESGLHI